MKDRKSMIKNKTLNSKTPAKQPNDNIKKQTQDKTYDKGNINDIV